MKIRVKSLHKKTQKKEEINGTETYFRHYNTNKHIAFQQKQQKIKFEAFA